MKQYVPVLSTIANQASPYIWEEPSREGSLRFDANTLPSPPPSLGRFVQDIRDGCPINEYADPGYTSLIQKIAAYEQVDPEMITITNSGDEAIDILAKAFLNPSDIFVTTPPTYEMYEIQCAINRGELCEIPLTQSFEVNEKELLRQSKDPKTKIIFLVNPNNPTGSIIPEQTLTRICKNSGCMVVVDEVYREFYGKSVVPFIAQYPNLVVLRSFSKFAGLAGARIGYLIASPTLTKTFTAIKLPMGVSYLSARLAEFVLQNDQEWVKEQAAMIKSERKKMTTAISAIGFFVFPSEANFLLVNMGIRASDICLKLRSKGILVRDRSALPYLTGCVRISVRGPKENDILLTALQEII